MRKNWLAAAWAHWFRANPLVPDAAFQGTSEPYPRALASFPRALAECSGGRTRRGQAHGPASRGG